MKEALAGKLGYFLILVAVAILLAAGGVLVFDLRWWAGLFLVPLLTGLTLGGFSLGKVWLERRKQRFVDAGGERGQARNKGLTQQGKSELLSLQQLWAAAVETLRHSRLRRHGNPLYALPWFLMLGASGSGKSSALRSARLASPIASSGRDQNIVATRQCEWHFFEQAVVIDTAGRYAVSLSEEQDREEWRKFLSLLIQYRRREPLNGLVVTVAADRLLEAESAQLENDGSSIRQRIDELMRAGGVRVPVYLLVTKCDLVPGLAGLCEQLPADCLHQPMGALNHELSQEAGSFVERALQATEERLRTLRLRLLQLPQERCVVPELLLFPEEFMRLKQGLVSFTAHAFGANPYQETPPLRGLFFSSGRQEGTPPGRFSRTTGLAGTGEPLPGTDQGLFLHDFFAKVLPKDRPGLVPTRRSLEWRALTGNLGLTAWALVGLAFCGLLSLSFVKNLHTMREFSHGSAKAAPLRGDLPADLATMERFRQDIQKVEEQNRHWWIPRFGLTESLKVEQGLKGRFCRQFQDQILTPAERQLEAGLATVAPATPDGLYGQYLMHLVRRINLLKARLHDNGLDALQAKPQPAQLRSLDTPAAAGTPEARRVLASLYLSFLIWREDSGSTSRELAKLQSCLKQLMVPTGSHLQWPAVWVDRESGLAALTLRDFWGGTLSVAGEKTLAPSFTRKGKEALDGLLGEMEAALGDPTPLAAQKGAFAAWYRGAALEAWHGFAADFHRGENSLHGPTEWQQAASKMASEQGPYFALVDRMVLELEPLTRETPMPPWLQQVGRFQAARAQALAQDNAAINNAAEGGKKLLTSIRKNVGQQTGARQLEDQMATAKASREYCGALRAIIPALASRSQAFQLASQTFGEEPATGKSPCYAANFAAARLQAGLSGPVADPVVGRLVNGPLDFLWTYLRREGAARLQGLWEEQVLAPTVGMTEQQAIPALLGPDGLAWRFVKGPAAPFLIRSLSGYGAKDTLGGKIAFENALFSFMGKGARAQATVLAMGRPQHYSVGIRGLPTDANAEARVKPHATRMEIQCGGTSQVLVNSNYPVGRTISWSPEACGDVSFQIEIGDVVLTRHYLGPQGFPDFLKDLHGGRRSFGVREFPGERSALERMGVKTITVHYQLIGSAAVLQQSAALSGQAPRSIARSWTP